MALTSDLALATLPEGSPARVLIVDDEPDLRLLLRMGLERDPGFEVVAEATDGDEGVTLATELQPDIVLLDLNMPRLDGRQALGPILVRSPRSMVVVLTALPAEVEAERMFEKGAFAFVEKSAFSASLAEDLTGLLGEFRRALRGETVLVRRHAVLVSPEAQDLTEET